MRPAGLPRPECLHIHVILSNCVGVFVSSVIPGSHINPVTIADEARSLPHPDEELVRMKAGDVVLVHNGCIR